MYIIKTSSRFEKDYKKIKKSGRHDIQKIKDVMSTLASGARLEFKFRDHGLSGNFKNRRECHIEPDWLLIYKIDNDTITFERTGSHAELFR